MGDHYDQRKFVVPEVIVGVGASLLVTRYLSHYSSKRPMIVTDKSISELDWFRNILLEIEKSAIDFVLYDEVTPNPKDYESMVGSELFIGEDCDSIVAIGGGSVIDCAKCISIVASNGGNILDYVGVDLIENPGPPLICVPSTSGSAADVSQFAIITDTSAKVKRAIISKKVVPDLSLIDPVPLMTMDEYLTACTGMDALTHAIEAYVSNASSDLTDVHALKAIELVSKHLLEATNISSRSLETMYSMHLASTHAGFAFSNASLGAVHAMAHCLGGELDLPHGECNSILLQRIVDLNYDSAQIKYADISRVFGIYNEKASLLDNKNALVAFISNFREKLGIKEYIALIPGDRNLITKMADAAMLDPCMVTNPKDLTLEEVVLVYEGLFQG